MAQSTIDAQGVRVSGARGELRYRHGRLVRVVHWINAACFAILLMSGLQIFNAHPALYWGADSDFDRPILQITGGLSEQGQPVGLTKIFGHSFYTTGVLGWSTVDGNPAPRAFPAWLTLPRYQDLATARVWHFFFAWLFVINGLVYLGYTFSSRHFSRDLLPDRSQWRSTGRSVRDHLRFSLVRREEAERYNLLQKLSYLAVILVLLPLVVLTGWTLSPGIDAAAPWLLDIFGGRQSARTIHFALAWLLVLFVLAHILMVLVSGPLNRMRSMITGWYAVDTRTKRTRS